MYLSIYMLHIHNYMFAPQEVVGRLRVARVPSLEQPRRRLLRGVLPGTCCYCLLVGVCCLLVVICCCFYVSCFVVVRLFCGDLPGLEGQAADGCGGPGRGSGVGSDAAQDGRGGRRGRRARAPGHQGDGEGGEARAGAGRAGVRPAKGHWSSAGCRSGGRAQRPHPGLCSGPDRGREEGREGRGKREQHGC